MSEQTESKSVPNTVAGFFEENVGEQSMMRLNSFICVCAGVVLMVVTAIMSLQGSTNTDAAVTIGTTLLATGIGGKLIQKIVEK